MKSLALWTILLLLLTACSAPNEIKQKNYKRTHEKKYLPILNTKPKYFVTISGAIDPQLMKKHITIKFNMQYASLNTACNVMINALEGVDSGQIRSLTFIPRQRNGKYELNIPLDHFKPGFCHWSAWRLDLQANHHLISTITDFGPCARNQSCHYNRSVQKIINQHPENIVKCKSNRSKQVDCSFVPYQKLFSSNWIISRKRSWSATINFDYTGSDNNAHSS